MLSCFIGNWTLTLKTPSKQYRTDFSQGLIYHWQSAVLKVWILLTFKLLWSWLKHSWLVQLVCLWCSFTSPRRPWDLLHGVGWFGTYPSLCINHLPELLKYLVQLEGCKLSLRPWDPSQAKVSIEKMKPDSTLTGFLCQDLNPEPPGSSTELTCTSSQGQDIRRMWLQYVDKSLHLRRFCTTHDILLSKDNCNLSLSV